MTPAPTLTRAALAALLAPGLAPPAPAQVVPEGTPEGFEHGYETANGVRQHYVRGGEGEPVVLLHGWPTTWYLWHEVMPKLAEAGYEVVAVDTRGRGATAMTEGGYDVRTVAADIRALVDALDLEAPHVVGHDLGGQVAFSYAHENPDAIQTLTIVEAPIPDAAFGALENPALDQNFWHFGFHDAEHLPEMLLEGRMPEYVGYFLDTFSYNGDAVSDEEAAVYASSHMRPGRLTAGLEYYRAVEQNVADVAEQAADGPLEMPVLAVSGEIGIGFLLLNQIDGYASDVTKVTLEQCGHWIPSECPDALLDEVLPFLAKGSDET